VRAGSGRRARGRRRRVRLGRRRARRLRRRDRRGDDDRRCRCDGHVEGCAMTSASTLRDRFARLRARMGEAGIDVLLVSPSADYRYLTGLVPPVPTRMTFLIVPLDGAIELVTPSLEAAGVETHAELQGLIVPVPWSDGDDPAAVAAARIRAHGTPKQVAVSDRTWARHLIPLGEQLGDAR